MMRRLSIPKGGSMGWHPPPRLATANMTSATFMQDDLLEEVTTELKASIRNNDMDRARQCMQNIHTIIYHREASKNSPNG
jgi:hypothetical protein